MKIDIEHHKRVVGALCAEIERLEQRVSRLEAESAQKHANAVEEAINNPAPYISKLVNDITAYKEAEECEEVKYKIIDSKNNADEAIKYIGQQVLYSNSMEVALLARRTEHDSHTCKLLDVNEKGFKVESNYLFGKHSYYKYIIVPMEGMK